jgi:hypothetical protein
VYLPHFFSLPPPVQLQLPVVDANPSVTEAGDPEFVGLRAGEVVSDVQVHEELLADVDLVPVVDGHSCLALLVLDLPDVF